METRILRFFQMEVERQCKFALIAVEDLQQSLKVINMDRIWYSIQALLVATGDISKLLWPTKPLLPERGKELRESLSISDNSPLESREFRNIFEHFDERLEKWATASGHLAFADSNVGPINMIGNFEPKDYMRHFDHTNSTLIFRGDLYELQPVIDAIQELWQKAAIEAKKPHNVVGGW